MSQILLVHTNLLNLDFIFQHYKLLRGIFTGSYNEVQFWSEQSACAALKPSQCSGRYYVNGIILSFSIFWTLNFLHGLNWSMDIFRKSKKVRAFNFDP